MRSSPPPPPDSSGEREAVSLVNARFYAAFESLDIDTMSRIWSERAAISCIHPGWAMVSGRARVLASWAGIFRGTERLKLSVREPQVFVCGTVAWVVLIEEIEAQHGSSVVHAFVQATNLFMLEADGWRLVHHHAAPTLAPEERAPPASGRTLH